MSPDPFEILIDIERNCRAHAKPIPRQHETGQIWQGVGFIAAETHFISPLTEIKEVLMSPRMAPLPSAAPWFLGVANLHGQILPITDLGVFLFGQKQSLSSNSRVLVISLERTLVGFLVQQVLGVQRFLDNTIKSVPEGEIQEGIQAYIQGEFRNELSRWYVVSLKTLSQSAQFYHVVKEAEVYHGK